MPDEAAAKLRASVEARYAAAPNDDDKRLRASFPTLERKFRQLRDAGLQLVVGTDCGSPGHYHGDAIWWDMATWHSLGVPPREIVRAATSIPAHMLRRPDLGTLAPPAVGDLVIYDGDVERGQFALGNVKAVLKGGNVCLDEGKWTD